MTTINISENNLLYKIILIVERLSFVQFYINEEQKKLVMIHNFIN